ncbi:hypothetical protein [Bacillus mycoides]|uniref:Uncharacterized protein n=1 Tax=Bacillus mycoides TaxID=1405 RepID=A0A1E8B436_BACMY|nr:hypothetical protein [Bacillus mycoides]OFD74950.1 hypothetical protein BWGOE9_37810 [Bacillus mycoides]OFD75064.1 hypothetical protein BWGOE8_37130 [Bacillus mycoides]OFD76586.1 hypothetical protein BWGOE10_37830 [Bacillus mycoides]
MAADGYKIRWFNKTIYMCEYLDDGLTKNMKNLFSENPKGTAYYIKQQIKFYNCNLKARLAYYNLYYDFVKPNVGLGQAAKCLDLKPAILIVAMYLIKFEKLLMFKMK